MTSSAVALVLALALSAEGAGWREDAEARPPEDWIETQYWKGILPVARWEEPKGKARILLQKFMKSPAMPSAQAYLASRWAKDCKGRAPAGVKEDSDGMRRVFTFRRCFEEIERDYGVTDMEPPVKSRRDLIEHVRVVDSSDSFYVLRFGTEWWRYPFYHALWKRFTRGFHAKEKP